MKRTLYILLALLVASTASADDFIYVKKKVAAGPPLSLPVTDNFNRTDANPLNGDWTKVTGYYDLKIVSNAVIPITDSAWAGYHRPVSESWPNDQYAQLKIVNDGMGWRGLFVRVNNDNNMYALHWDESSWYVKRVDATVETTLGSSGSWTVTTTDTIKFSVVGTTLTVYKNGVSQGTRTDSTYSSGNPGFGMYSGVPSGSGVDDWEGGAP